MQEIKCFDVLEFVVREWSVSILAPFFLTNYNIFNLSLQFLFNIKSPPPLKKKSINLYRVSVYTVIILPKSKQNIYIYYYTIYNIQETKCFICGFCNICTFDVIFIVQHALTFCGFLFTSPQLFFLTSLKNISLVIIITIIFFYFQLKIDFYLLLFLCI